MKPVHIKHVSFAGGEISPLMYGRSDLQKHASSLKTCKNFFIHPQGPASNRPGTFYMASTKDPSKKSRLISFEFNTDNCYAMEFGEGYIRFFTESGAVLGENGTVYEVQTDYTQSELAKIIYAQSADVVYLACEGHPPKTLTRYGHTNWTFENYPFKNGPFKSYDGEAKGHIQKSATTSTVNFLLSLNSQSLEGTIFSSETGEKWTLDKNFTTLLNANGLFFKFEEGRGYTCSDGHSWVFRGMFPSEKRVCKIFYINGAYFASTEYGLYRSIDLASWQELEGTVAPLQGRYVKNGWYVAYLNGSYFAVGFIPSGNILLTSSDGVIWTETWRNDKHYDVSPKISYFAGKYLMRYWESADGLTWTENVNARPGVEGNGVLLYTEPRWYKSYEYDALISSLDGVNWTDVKSFGLGEKVMGGIIFKDGVFYAAGGQTLSGNTAGWIFKGTPETGFSQLATLPNAFVNGFTSIHVEGGTTPLQLIALNYDFRPDLVGTKLKLERNFSSSGISCACGENYDPQSLLKNVVLCGGSWNLITSGTWSGKIIMQTSEDGENWTDHKTMTSVSDSKNYEVPGDFSGSMQLVRFDARGLTSGTCKLDFTTFAFTSYVYMTATGYLEPKRVTVDLSEESAAFKDYIDEKQGNLYIGSWSDSSGWPSSVCIYQGRVCWGKDFTIDATKVEEYTNFGTSLPLNDSDAISTNVRSGGLNVIQHLVAGNNLIALTSGGEFKSRSENFIPTDCGMIPQTNYGSSGVRPVKVGGNVIFIQAGGTSLRDMSYVFQNDLYDGSDLCLYAEHLFFGRQIVDLAYQRQPDSLLWVVLDDGTLLCLTYLKDQDIYAWSRCETDGQVESVCALNGTGQTDLFLIVRRGNNRFVEKMARRLPTSYPEDQLFLDCAVAFESNEDVQTIGGLEHLEGKRVGVLNEGSEETPKTVENGSITLTDKTKKAFIGLPYSSELELLPAELPLEDGAMSAHKYRIGRVSVKLSNSRGGEVGTGGVEKKERWIYRKISDWNVNPLPLQSVTFTTTVAGSHKFEPTVVVRQNSPLPLTVVSITETLV